MLRSTRRRSRKHERDERDRSDSDEDQRPLEQEGKKGSVRDSKGSDQHEKRLFPSLAKLPNAGEASGSSVEGQRKRKSRGDEEAVTGDDRWNGSGEDERLSYYDSKKSRNSDADVKGKSGGKLNESDRSNEAGRRKSEKEALLEEHSAREHHQVKGREKEQEAEKSNASKQVFTLKEDGMDQQYKMAKDRNRDHEKGNDGKHGASLKALSRTKEGKTEDMESDRPRNKSNGTDVVEY